MASLMLDFLFDHGFLDALAAAIGPLAVFIAPTQEIESILAQSPLKVGLDQDADANNPSLLVVTHISAD
jgi:hypothetical protein